MEQVRDLVTQAADPGRSRDERLCAFAQLVERFQGMACGYAYSILGDFHVAEDAAQEAFILAYRQLADLREPAAFVSWLRRLVHTACHRTVRKAQLPTVPLVAAEQVQSTANEPAVLVEGREMGEQVLRAIRDLPPNEREATTLFYINGYSQQEVADFLEVPVSTVKNRLHASRGRLKERMLHMVKETLHENAPDERFSRKVIDELLARPRPLELPDHPVRKVWDAIRAALSDYEVIDSEELVDRAEQKRVSGGLGYAYPGEAGKALRTCTTGATIRAMAGRTPPVKLVTVGRVFRASASSTEDGLGTGEDPWHSRIFHNADVLCVKAGVTVDEMKALVERILRGIFGASMPAVRWEADSFPSFEQGLDLAAQFGEQWLSLAGCGLLPTRLLEQAGFDPRQVGGFAFGLGLERLAMLRFGVKHIRELWQPPYVPR
jgi:RNA polymerase sigma factor (sigma-70 family)